MRVLLINPPNNMDVILGKVNVFVNECEPHALMYIAAVLEQEGHQVKILDAFALNYSLEQTTACVDEYQPQVVGITCLTSTGALAYRIGQRIKEKYPDIKVIFGNVHASVFHKAFLENRAADVVVHGEGEYTMLDLLKVFQNGGDLSNVPGISWWDGNRVIKNPMRDLIPNLDMLPFPARHLLPVEKYSVRNLSNFIFINRTDKLMKHMFTSRGCTYQCSFCVVHQKRKYRYNNPKRAVDEMELLVRKYNTCYIFFMDPLFVANRKRVIQMCEEILRRNLNFYWGCEGHVKLVDSELLQWMEKAGCYEIHYGIESGVQRLLDNVQKGTTIEQVERAVHLTKRTNIKVSGLFMLGLPGETYNDSLQTIDFMCALPLDFAQVGITVPYPGSQLFEDMAEAGTIDTGVRPDGSVDLSVWERYSAYASFNDKEPIYVPEGMSTEELKYLQKLALRRFYLRPRHIFRQSLRFRFDDIPRIARTFKSVFVD